MCGVGGILSAQEEDHSERLRKMSLSLRHRGPDGEDFYSDGPLSLFHRLLRIHSPRTKPGPYVSSDGRWVLSFNGEVYNEASLRKELDQSRPFEWRHESDAEVFLEGWAREGKRFVERINGMFAFALWDRHERKLILGRDRFGEKPLYYVKTGKNFYFASEVKAFQAAGLEMALEQESLSDYLAYRYVSGPMTLFRGIRKVAPAHFLEVDENLRLREERYWSPQHRGFSRSEEDQSQELENLLADAHAIRSRGLKSPSIFLSGGIDSSTVASFLPEKSKAWTFVSEGTADETDLAKETSLRFGHEHASVQDEEASRERWREAILATEEPLGDSIPIPTLSLARAAHSHSRVVFSGEGADEVFAGYVHQVAAANLFALQKRIGPRGLSLAQKSLNAVPFALLGKLIPYSVGLSVDAKDRMKMTLMRLSYKQGLGSDLTRLFEIETLASVRFQREKEIHSLRDLIRLDLETWLPDYTLTRMDKILMSQSLEGRLPFLDHRLYEFCLGLKGRDLVRGREGKWILRKAMEKRLGRKVAWRKKVSFLYRKPVPLTAEIYESDFVRELHRRLLPNATPNFLNEKKASSLRVLDAWIGLFGVRV